LLRFVLYLLLVALAYRIIRRATSLSKSSKPITLDSDSAFDARERHVEDATFTEIKNE
jgi:hypothetical protein